MFVSYHIQPGGGKKIMGSCEYTIEVTGLSPNTSESDLYDFFAFSGEIERVEFVRSGDYGCTAYVTFKDAHSQQTAVLLSGAKILDHRVCISRWGDHGEDYSFWRSSSVGGIDETDSNEPTQRGQFVPNAGEAVTRAQEVVKAMLAKGYVLGKDALSEAKAFDEAYQVSATATAKVAEISQRIGFTNTIAAGMEAVKSADEKFGVSEFTISAASATGRTAAAAANAAVNSSYFSQGALWVSGALNRAAKAAEDLGRR